MPKTHAYKGARRMLAVTPVLLAGLLLTACGGGSDHNSSANPSGSGSGVGSSPSNGSADRGLAFAKCMRENGVPHFPDPGPGGRIVIGGGGVDASSPEFQKAQQACKDLSPQGQSVAGGGSLDPAKVTAWAQCVRDHGVPKFADPQINGNALALDLAGSGISAQSNEFQTAMRACQTKLPQGARFMVRNGGGQ